MSEKSRISPPAKESQYYTASDLRRVIGMLGFVVAHIKGVSMRPLIWQNGHYAVIKRLEGKPEIGAILAFEHIRREATAYIVHRLIAIEDIDGTEIYVMRGDNCLNCERIREEDIIGEVAEIYRIGGWRPWHALPKSHFTTSDKSYLLYSKIWDKTWPMRKRLYKLKGTLSKIKHKLR